MKLLKQSLFTDKYSRKEGESRIYNLIILDESGSMGPIREQTISGANEVLHTILKAQQENPDDNQMISVVTFDNWGNRDTVRAIINCMKIEEVSNLTYKDYNPDGLTPLYDAIGHSLTDLNKLVQKEDNVLVTIITDGMENASKDYSAEGIRNLIKELTDMGWVFTFIGANQDSILSARQLNIRSAMDFETTGTGAQIMFSRMDAGMSGFFKKVRFNKKNKEEVMFMDYITVVLPSMLRSILGPYLGSVGDFRDRVMPFRQQISPLNLSLMMLMILYSLRIGILN